ncbi:FxsC protein [Streptomyces sp. NPDC091209]|uniref:FxsC protein n=1 Tax=Streptomyces sp. NPDC091209 TaxID=3365974 RepID=UPI0037F622B8
MGPLFFISYASSTGDRGPVQRFHIDVQNEIYSVLGRTASAEGRLKHPEPAAGPDPAVLDCRALLVLYSAQYVDDSQCATEWSVFAERVERRMRRTGERPDSLVGVVWRPDGLVLPRPVSAVRHIVDEEYQGPGVLGLQQDPDGRDRYQGIVRRVAARLMRAAASPPPVMSEAEGHDVVARFGPDHAAVRTRPPAPKPPRSAGQVPASDRADRNVTLLLMTGTADRMRNLRERVDGYGQSAEEWRPFRPHSEETVASTVGWALRACGGGRLAVTAPRPGDPLPHGIDASTTVLLVVDPWLTGDPAFRALWERIARSRARVAAVVVVLARCDEESMVHAGRLREAVSRTPARMLGAAHHEAGSRDALAHIVVAVMADSRTRTQDDTGGTWARTGELTIESPDDRRSRRQRERVGWLRRAANSWPPILSTTPGESLGPS